MPTQFPAFCPNCGLIFQSRLIAVEGEARGITMIGNREQCPRCGAWAELPDGTFDVVGDTIHVLFASGLTRERLSRLSTILEEAHAGNLSADAAAEAVVREAPSLEPLVQRLAPAMQRAFFWFLLMVIQVLLAQGLAELRDDSATRQDVRDAVVAAVERCKAAAPDRASLLTRR